MTEGQETQPRPLEEASRKELNQIADEFGVSKKGTNEEVITRIRAAKDPQPVDESEGQEPDVEEDVEAEPQKATSTPVRRKKPEEVFSESMREVSIVLANAPSVLDIIRVKRTIRTDDSEFNVDGYAWADKSGEAMRIRRKIKSVLETAWQSGALNYESISRSLRVSDMSVRALLDEEFIAANGF